MTEELYKTTLNESTNELVDLSKLSDPADFGGDIIDEPAQIPAGVSGASLSPIDKVIQILENELGYLEKKSNYMLYDKTANAGYNNYTKYWADIAPEYQAQPWCAGTITWSFVKVFGIDATKKLLKHYPYINCEHISELFKLHSNPQKGDIVIFYRNGEFVHTGYVISVDGDYFKTIEGNTSGGSSIIDNGGGLFKKGYYNSNLPGTKFIRPDYSLVENEEDKEMTAEEKARVDSIDNSLTNLYSIVTDLKTTVESINDTINNKMIYNYIDENMPEWAREGVQWCIDNGIIQGTGEGLGLDDKDLKYCTIMMRLAKKCNE